jgi:hypothetical protein
VTTNQLTNPRKEGYQNVIQQNKMRPSTWSSST